MINYSQQSNQIDHTNLQNVDGNSRKPFFLPKLLKHNVVERRALIEPRGEIH